jgi:endonuclease G
VDQQVNGESYNLRGVGKSDAIAFLVPHRAISKGDLPGFIVSVDEVKRRTGLDFNSMLDDTVEDDIEDGVEAMW